MSVLMITGGTGSFGQAYTKWHLDKLADYNIDKHGYPYPFYKIIIYSRDEMKQHQMAESLKSHPAFGALRFFIGDVRDYKRLLLAMRGVTHLVHAAALKIVPTLEYNPFEAVKTNVLGAQNVIEACMNAYPGNISAVCISTDKAVYPINLYGATKLTMEKLWSAANNVIGGNNKYFRVVRYGNVTGSRGSVIPIFAEQKRTNQPATVTHPEMTRFWLTMDDAIKLVNHAFLSNIEGQNVSTLCTPMMPAYSIQDLVEAFGFDKITSIGVRPGEKMHESIITAEEAKQLGVEYTTSETVRRMSISELKTLLTSMGYI